MARQILFTGATGTIGAPMLERLREHGPDLHIRILDINEPKAGPNVEWVRTDLRDSGIDYDALVRDCDFVLHLAAETRPHHRHFDQVNNVATGELAAAAERSGTVRHFVYTSTCLAYGFPKTRYVADGQRLTAPPFLPPNEPMLDYAMSKYQSEKTIEQVASRVKYAILRPVHVVRPEQIKADVASLRGLRKLWWGHRPWHAIPTTSAVEVLDGFLDTSLWEHLPTISYYNFSADDPNYLTFDAARGRPGHGLGRAIGPATVPYLDMVKDMVKLRYGRRAWNYSSVFYDGQNLRKLGLHLNNRVTRSDQN